MNAVRCIGEQKQNINSLRSLCCLALATCHEKCCHCCEEQEHERFADRLHRFVCLVALTRIITCFTAIAFTHTSAAPVPAISSSADATWCIATLAGRGIVKRLIHSALVGLVGYIGDLVSVIKGAISTARHTRGATWHAITALRHTAPDSIVHTTIPLLCRSGRYASTRNE